MTDVYVAAGSNIDPIRHLQAALAALAEAYAPLKISPAYRNKAVGFAGADFVNLVMGFVTEEPPAAVRERLQQIEQRCGRPPDAPRWAPRSMDLDILLFGELVSDAPGLVVPRPDLVQRAYMLKPMADIAPDLVHPTLRKTMRELWEAFEGKEHEMVEVAIDGATGVGRGASPSDASPPVHG